MADDMDPGGRGNGDTGGQETPPENTIQLGEWGHPSWSDDVRPRRPDGQIGSNVANQDDGSRASGLSTAQTAAVVGGGALGVGALLMVLA